MARNGSGTHSIPNTLVSGTTITASDHNENYSDISSEITNSVAADGQTSMTGPLKASSGTDGAPSVTFSADTDTGIYRSSANELSVTAGGVQIHKTSSAGLDVVSGRLKQGGASLVPPGAIIPYAGSSAPTGWLLCDGSQVSQTTYVDLYTAIGSTFNTGGETAGNFRVPDLGGRVPAGKEATATRLTSAASGIDGGTLGATGGSQTHTLTTAQLASHSHGVTDPGHYHLPPASGGGGGNATDNSRVSIGLQFSSNTNGPNTDTKTTGITVDNAGSGSAHNNAQPTIVLNYIIKT